MSREFNKELEELKHEIRRVLRNNKIGSLQKLNLIYEVVSR